MPVVINGTTGITNPDGSAGTPSLVGTDSNTGIFFPAADTIAFSEGGVEAVRIDSSGNVGIGTSSPGAKLEVYTGASSSVDFTGLRMTNGGENGTNLDFYNAFGPLAQVKGTKTGAGSGADDGVLTFSTATNSVLTERVRIDDSGNLLVGKTSVSAFTTQGIEIAPSSTSANLAVTSTSASNYDMVRLTRTGTTGIMIGFFNGTSRVGDVSIGASSTSYNTSSDYRLKDTIAPMQGALARVAALKPCTYKWKVDGSDGEGFIAHELQAVVPDCVTGEKDAVNEDGNPIHQGIDTSFLVATLTAAIQEQQALITALTTRITALEAA